MHNSRYSSSSGTIIICGKIWMVDVPLLRLMITYTVEAMPIEARAQTHHLPHMAVSINGGTPKWLVYNGKIPNKMDALGVPPVLGNLHIIFYAYPTFVGPVCQSNLRRRSNEALCMLCRKFGRVVRFHAVSEELHIERHFGQALT